MPECEIDVSALAEGRPIVTQNPITITEIEPDRCIILDVIGLERFELTVDRAQDMYKTLGELLGDL